MQTKRNYFFMHEDSKERAREKKRLLRKGLLSAILGLGLSVCLITPAFAATEYGPKVQGVAAGSTTSTTGSSTKFAYYGQAMCSYLSDGGNAYAITSASRVVPAGWLGARTMLYNQNALQLAGNVAYSTFDTQYFTTWAQYKSLQYPSYFAAGYVYGYHLGGYKSSYLPQTPYSQMALSTDELAVDTYPINDNGMTYGSGLSAEFVGTPPDLIASIGINGVEGYTKQSDLDALMPSGPEEAVQAYSAERVVAIPVYAVDGDNIVDLFEITIGGGVAEQPE